MTTKYVCIRLQFEALAKQRRPINTLRVEKIFYYHCILKSKETRVQTNPNISAKGNKN